MYLVLTENKGKSAGRVVEVAETNLTEAAHLEVVSVGDLNKYLVADDAVPNIGDIFDGKGAVQVASKKPAAPKKPKKPAATKKPKKPAATKKPE